MFRLLTLVCLIVVFDGREIARAADPVAQEPARDAIVQDEFFSGSVTEVSEVSVSVCRNLPGKSPETRVFTMDSETVIEGKLKKQARVTVGYHSYDGQDHAWRIIVRESPE